MDDGAEYGSIKATAWLAVLMYPLGLLALNAALLFSAREAISRQRPTPLSRAIAFLHAEYEPQVCARFGVMLSAILSTTFVGREAGEFDAFDSRVGSRWRTP